jgi:outer membrane protein assembly factor BamB
MVEAPVVGFGFSNCECVAAISNGVLYVGGDNAMYAFNASTGTPLWKTQISPPQAPPPEFSETTVAGSVVYAATPEKVYAFDAHTGAVLWFAVASGLCCPNGPVSVANGLAYVTEGNHLVAYNANTGSLVFTSSAPPGTFFGSGTAVSNGVVYVQGHLVLDAFNATTGALLWTSPTMSQGVSTPAVDGSTVVVSTWKYLIAFGASDGHRLWTLDGGADQQPVIANGVVYADTLHGTLYGLQALSEASGAVLRPGGFAPCAVPAIVSHGAVWATCQGKYGAVAEFGL